MKSRDIVLQAITRNYPPRVPLHYHNRDVEFSDTIDIKYRPAASFVETEPGLSEWGYVWRKLDATMGQPHNHPLADWERIDSYVPPDPNAPGRLDHVAPLAAMFPDKLVVVDMGITGANVAMFLRGFEAFVIDLYQECEQAERVIDLVMAYENGIIRRAAEGPADAVRFGDDWGMQQGLIIDPRLWRQVFAPRYEAQFALAHSLGLKVWFHTCGDVFSIIGDLIACGADVIELLQPDIFGVERLGDTFGGKVCFACSVDHQRRAISGTREEIVDYTQRLQRSLGGKNGGYIGFIEDYSSLGMSETNYQWLRAAFHGLPPYEWT